MFVVKRSVHTSLIWLSVVLMYSRRHFAVDLQIALEGLLRNKINEVKRVGANSLTLPRASERCHQEKRKTINGEDILFAMQTLGFDNYVEPLKLYLQKYREV